MIGRPDRSGPSPMLPLAYLACATVAFLAAAIGTAWLAPELAGHYYHPRVLALTHTVTLGWITLSIMGASYQLIPVVLGRSIWSERLAWWELGVWVAGVTGMVAHFSLGSWGGLGAAAAMVAVGVAMHLVNVGLSLRGFTEWTFTARLMMLAHAGLCLTALLGVALAANHLWPVLPGAFLDRLHAHVQLALLGWIAPMILAVAARVYPMFLLAPPPLPWTCLVQLWGIGVGVPAVVAGLLGPRGLLPLGAFAVAAAAGSHAWSVLEMARARKRPSLDWGLRFSLTATAFILPACVLGLGLAAGRLSGSRAALGYAVSVLGGWISLTIAGMMLKIVPFLVWYRAYGSRAGRERVPMVGDLSAPRLEGLAHGLLAGGMSLLTVATLAGDAAWIRASGAILTLGALAFAAAIARALGHLSPRGRTQAAPLGRAAGEPAR